MLSFVSFVSFVSFFFFCVFYRGVIFISIILPMFYFPATPSSTATLLWLLRCYPNDLTGIVILSKTIYYIKSCNFVCYKITIKINYSQYSRLYITIILELLLFNSLSSFHQSELLPSDRQLVHHECMLHRCVADQRLLEIPSSCHRVSGDNPLVII